jgi:hypothetical protein
MKHTDPIYPCAMTEHWTTQEQLLATILAPAQLALQDLLYGHENDEGTGYAIDPEDPFVKTQPKHAEFLARALALHTQLAAFRKDLYDSQNARVARGMDGLPEM